MQRSDVRAVGELAGEASSVLTTLVRGMHAGIASRVFDAIGPAATPTRMIHDGLTQAIYATVDHGIRGATHAAGVVAAEVWGNEADEALESRSDSAAAVIAAVNGLYGDELTERENPLAGPMVIRRGDKPVALTTESLAAAYPAASNRGCRLRARLVPHREVLVSAAARRPRQPQLWRTAARRAGIHPGSAAV